MRKFVLIVVLAALAAGGVFAQAKGAAAAAAKNALSVDVVPLFKGVIAADSDAKTGYFGLGVFYERALGKNYAFGMRMDLYVGKEADISHTFFGLDAHGRWYPLSPSLEKLFLDAGVGVSVLSVDGSIDNGFMGLTIGLKTGWKQKIGKKFFMEPSIGYVLAKSDPSIAVTPLGWQIGLGAGLLF